MNTTPGLKIACLSDLHGFLPGQVEADLALIAGDLCPHGSFGQQHGWLTSKFYTWIQEWKCPVVYIAGNHDRVMAEYPGTFPGLPVGHYIEHKSTMPFFSRAGHPHQLLRVSPMPWTLPYGRWWFQASEAEIAWRLPKRTDILLSHGPALNIGDVGWKEEHAGSKAILDWIEETSPKLVVHGHIHEGYGIYGYGKTKIVNAAICNAEMKPVNPIITITLP